MMLFVSLWITFMFYSWNGYRLAREKNSTNWSGVRGIPEMDGKQDGFPRNEKWPQSSMLFPF